MSYLDEPTVEEYAEGHEEHTAHITKIDWDIVNEDGQVKAFCTDCEWEKWATDG